MGVGVADGAGAGESGDTGEGEASGTGETVTGAGVGDAVAVGMTRGAASGCSTTALPATPPTAVSYTHLDVYKRQE